MLYTENQATYEQHSYVFVLSDLVTRLGVPFETGDTIKARQGQRTAGSGGFSSQVVDVLEITVRHFIKDEDGTTAVMGKL